MTDASYKSAKMSNFDASKILTGTTIAGVAGNVTLPATTDVRKNTTYGSSLGSTGSLVEESHGACSTDGVGTTGSCYTTDAYKSAQMSTFDKWSIVAGKTIAGVAGSAYVGSLLSSGAHHDMNATPGNMTYAQELGLGASTLWRTITTSGNTGYGYREVPLIAKDDDGYDATTSTNPVTKLRARQWEHGAEVALGQGLCAEKVPRSSPPKSRIAAQTTRRLPRGTVS